MSMQEISCEDARPKMKAGDVIAFGGKGQFSEIIKFATRSTVSHVGVSLQTKEKEETTERFFNLIIESTSLHGYNGVTISRLSGRHGEYNGDIWWLPLKQGLWESNFDRKKFYDFLFHKAQERVPYDMPQAIKSSLDALDQLPLDLHGPTYNWEDFSRFFCSELVAAGLEEAGVVPKLNASEVTPIDICRWNIYDPYYFSLKGDPTKRISGFNTLEPSLWDI